MNKQSEIESRLTMTLTHDTPTPSDNRVLERRKDALLLQGRLALAIIKNPDITRWSETNPVESAWLLDHCANWIEGDVHNIVQSLLRWGDLSDRQLAHVRLRATNKPGMSR